EEPPDRADPQFRPVLLSAPSQGLQHLVRCGHLFLKVIDSRSEKMIQVQFEGNVALPQHILEVSPISTWRVRLAADSLVIAGALDSDSTGHSSRCN
ncbi:unnamed protein product, partial [Symbiodinium sp. CCMP2456]